MTKHSLDKQCLTFSTGESSAMHWVYILYNQLPNGPYLLKPNTQMTSDYGYIDPCIIRDGANNYRRSNSDTTQIFKHSSVRWVSIDKSISISAISLSIASYVAI